MVPSRFHPKKILNIDTQINNNQLSLQNKQIIVAGTQNLCIIPRFSLERKTKIDLQNIHSGKLVCENSMLIKCFSRVLIVSIGNQLNNKCSLSDNVVKYINGKQQLQFRKENQ